MHHFKFVFGSRVFILVIKWIYYLQNNYMQISAYGVIYSFSNYTFLPQCWNHLHYKRYVQEGIINLLLF